MTAMLDPIADVAVRTLTVPLPRPLRLSSMEITERRYAVVTVQTRDGLTGRGYALTRDLPVAALVQQLRPVLIGRDADLILARYEDCMRASLAGGRTGAVMRAIALIDVALWDIKAQRAALPLWRLLGGCEPRVPLVLVAGYPREDEPPAALARRVVDHALAGHTLLKVARAGDREGMHALLDRLTVDLPDHARVIVDCGWAYRRPDEVIDDVRGWPQAPIAWIEDPLPPEDVSANRRLRERLPMPLGIGDDLADLAVARDLVLREAVDVIRVDVGTLGFTGARRVCSLAEAVRIPVSLHVYPELSVHVAAAVAPGTMVESFDPADNPFDPTQEFLSGGPTLTPGWATAPDEPGLGVRFDDDRLAAA